MHMTTTGRFNVLAHLTAALICSVVLVSASPSLVLDQAYLQSTVSTDFVVSSSSSGSSCFVPRCLTPDAANQRRLLRFGLRVQNQGDAEASLALGSAAASTVTNDACSAATSINDFVSLAVKDSSNAVKASGVRDLCLFDQETVTGYSGGGSVPSAPVYSSCRTSTPSGPVQGLSAGWQVTYTKDVTCMYLDITGLAAGSYTLEATLTSVFNGSAESTTTAPFTIDNSCPPAANYGSPQYTPNTAAAWVDPVANGHTSVALPSAGSFSASVGLGSTPWIFGCTNFESFAMDVAGRVSFAAQGSSVPTDTKLDFTLAPFNALFLNGTGYYQLTGTSPSRVLLVSWVDMKASDTYTNLAWQAEINESGDVVFRYRNVTYQLDGVDAGEGRRQNIYVCGGGDEMNCAIFTEQAVTNGSAVVSDNSTVRFPRRLPGDGTTRPTVSMSNSPSGNSFVEGTVVTFTASTSAPATLGWSFGDRFYPQEITETGVHNFTTPGTYNVRLTAFDGTYYVTSSKTIIIVSSHGGGGWDSEDTLALMLGLFIPLTVIVCVVAIIVAAVIFFFGRGIVPSGGAWWNKDPEYVNTEAPIAAAL